MIRVVREVELLSRLLFPGLMLSLASGVGLALALGPWDVRWAASPAYAALVWAVYALAVALVVVLAERRALEAVSAALTASLLYAPVPSAVAVLAGVATGWPGLGDHAAAVFASLLPLLGVAVLVWGAHRVLITKPYSRG